MRLARRRGSSKSWDRKVTVAATTAILRNDVSCSQCVLLACQPRSPLFLKASRELCAQTDWTWRNVRRAAPVEATSRPRRESRGAERSAAFRSGQMMGVLRALPGPEEPNRRSLRCKEPPACSSWGVARAPVRSRGYFSSWRRVVFPPAPHVVSAGPVLSVKSAASKRAFGRETAHSYFICRSPAAFK